MPLLWSKRREIVEWLAAQYRDMATMPAAQAKAQAEADYARDPVEAAKRAGSFAAYVESTTGVRDPRRVGNWRP